MNLFIKKYVDFFPNMNKIINKSKGSNLNEACP